MSSSTICGYPSWRSNRRQAARSECLLGFQCSALAALARNARLPKNARLAMLGLQRSARNVIPYAQLAMLSSHVTVPGPTEARIALPRLEVLGSKRSGSQRSARVALLRLKVSGSRIVIYLFASSVIMSRVRGNLSSRASVACSVKIGVLKYLTFERAHGWQGSRLAIYQKLPSKRT